MKEKIRDYLLKHLDFLPPELQVVVISAAPVLELRGGLPLAYLYGFSFIKALTLCVIGNLLPVIPLLLLFQPVSRWLMRFSWYKKFYDWLYRRTLKKGQGTQKLGALGLILFTAVPLPTTGAYSACAAAAFFSIRFGYALAAISAGVVIAGVAIAGIIYSVF